MQRLFAAFLLVLFTLNAQALSNQERLDELKEARPLKRISFGSCNDQLDPQPLWNDLLKQKPDLWIWGGDNVYVDWMSNPDIETAYAIQNKNPLYAQFKRQTPFIGTWDDHDYSGDNADGSFAKKAQSQKHFLDFIEVPRESLLREQEGIYQSHTFGTDERKIKIILLDNRYFKNLDPEYPMLGRTQWEWLENELTSSDAKIHFIMTGLSVLSPTLPITEEWAETNELKRMLELLGKTKPRGVVFLTGDKHFASIFKRWGHLEFMSSGMTHTVDRKAWYYLGRKYPTTFFGLNYGQIDIAWERDVPTLELSIRTQDSRSVHHSKFSWLEGSWRPVK